MTSQNTQSEYKKLQHSRLQSGGEICIKHSKFPQPNQTARFFLLSVIVFSSINNYFINLIVFILLAFRLYPENLLNILFVQHVFLSEKDLTYP